jgi:hypothetical protein
LLWISLDNATEKNRKDCGVCLTIRGSNDGFRSDYHLPFCAWGKGAARRETDVTTKGNEIGMLVN